MKCIVAFLLLLAVAEAFLPKFSAALIRGIKGSHFLELDEMIVITSVELKKSVSMFSLFSCVLFEPTSPKNLLSLTQNQKQS